MIPNPDEVQEFPYVEEDLLTWFVLLSSHRVEAYSYDPEVQTLADTAGFIVADDLTREQAHAMVLAIHIQGGVDLGYVEGLSDPEEFGITYDDE